MVKLKTLKTNKGLYVATATYGTDYSDYRVNGLDGEATFSPQWNYYAGMSEVQKLERKVTLGRELTHYEIKDPNLVVDGKIPDKLCKDDLQYDEDGYATGSYAAISSLYQPVYAPAKSHWQGLEFEVTKSTSADIDNIEDPVKMKISLYGDPQYPNSSGTREVDLKSITSIGELDAMLTPDIMHHYRPCSLTSKQTFEVIRKFLNENLDRKEATIESNYAFHLKVCKKVHVKPWVKKTEIKTAKGRSYAKPKFKTQTIQEVLVPVYDIVPKGETRWGGTPIEGFKGENLNDLAEQVKVYLDELLAYLNYPVSRCEHCKGTGHIVADKFHPNEGRG
jgi:hypothetical protein